MARNKFIRQKNIEIIAQDYLKCTGAKTLQDLKSNFPDMYLNYTKELALLTKISKKEE